MKFCYYCGKKATTKEHVPPKSFFPESERKQLFTVPACEKHNNDNSKDVEYVRNIITMYIGNNFKGLMQFKQKTFKSFSKSPALYNETIKNFRADESIPSLKVDIDRIERVFNAIGKGLYFKDFQEIYSKQWKVFNYNLFTQNEIKNGSPNDSLAEWKTKLNRIKYIEQETSNPEIFKYFVYREDRKIIYKLEFYQGYYVFLF